MLCAMPTLPCLGSLSCSHGRWHESLGTRVDCARLMVLSSTGPKIKPTFLIPVNEALSAYAHNCTLGLSLQQQESNVNKC